MSVGALLTVAETVDDVLRAGRKLNAELADPERAGYAADLLVDRLGVVPEGSIHRPRPSTVKTRSGNHRCPSSTN